MEYAENAALLRPPHAIQLYRVANEETMPLDNKQAFLHNEADLNGTNQYIFLLYKFIVLHIHVLSFFTLKVSDLAYLFGGPLADRVLGTLRDFRITEQMRHLVGTFIKQG